MSSRTWSEQQQAIFAHLADGNAGNLVVRARAGTGKTTTIIEGVRRAPEQRIMMCAFNKRIAEELTGRINRQGAEAKTLHSLGNSFVWRNWPGIRVRDKKDSPNMPSRAEWLTLKVCGVTAPEPIMKLVSKLHTLGREINPHAREVGDLTDILYRFDCYPDEQWEYEGFDPNYIESRALEAMELAASRKPVETGIDFSDMIFLPCRNKWLRPTYGLVVVDEAQDMTTAQLEIAEGISRKRVVVVGDDRQAIYGFRGADSDSLDRLKAKLKAKELGLTTTYRCGKSIVAMAAVLVPDFMAAESNPEGLIRPLGQDKLTEEAQHGDFILSRKNAPLVSMCLALLAANKRARIAGRDIGAGLKALIKKLRGRNVNTLEALMAKLDIWEERQVAKFASAGRTEKVDEVRDRANMLRNLADMCESVDQMDSKIESLFTDDGLGAANLITCSSVHKAKGLEADRVFLIESTFRNDNQEELNIRYVAITRAKKELVLVGGVEATPPAEPDHRHSFEWSEHHQEWICGCGEARTGADV